jgi:hypothetical protein
MCFLWIGGRSFESCARSRRGNNIEVGATTVQEHSKNTLGLGHRYQRFRRFAEGKLEWNEVVALLPTTPPRELVSHEPLAGRDFGSAVLDIPFHTKLDQRPTYGNPIDFRGLRHEPVNEQGVVFLFGMLARELGYAVEAVQTGYPDCEAKRQIDKGRWQRVRIEFEFESRNFRIHGHSLEGCDLIVCWRHNWIECPAQIEVLELQSVIKTLGAEEE